MIKLVSRPKSASGRKPPKVRRELALKDSELGREWDLEKDESVEKYYSMKFEQLFLGQYYGVGLSRYDDDPHVRFTLLAKRCVWVDRDIDKVDEPGKWFIVTSKKVPKGRASNTGWLCDVVNASSFFIFDLAEVLVEACNWLKENAYPDEASSGGCTFIPSGVIGWTFEKINDD